MRRFVSAPLLRPPQRDFLVRWKQGKREGAGEEERKGREKRCLHIHLCVTHTQKTFDRTKQKIRLLNYSVKTNSEFT